MAETDWRVLGDPLRYWAVHDPGRLAYADRHQRASYGELAERATARAAGLSANGVHRGDHVVIAMSAGVALAEVFWALQLLGAAPCVLNPAVPERTLARRVELVAPRLVVTDALAQEIPVGAADLTGVDVGPDDLAYLQLTSGTTGEPRASLILQRNVMAYLRTARSHAVLGHEDVLVSWVPPWHDLGLVRFLIGAAYHGASCHIVEPAVRTIPEWITTISVERGTYSHAPDFALRLAVRMVDADAVDLSSLRCMKCGGEPVRASTIEAFESHFDLPGAVAPGYGLGEAVLGISEHLPGEEVPVDEHGNVSCGPPNPGLELRAGHSMDEPDEIAVRGETVFAGYLNAPEDSARVLRDGWLHTGDSGYTDAEGRLYVLGRRDGMLKRGGSIVAPRELEDAAQRVAGVRLAAAVGLTDEHRGEDRIVVAVEVDPDDGRSSQDLAASISREVLADVGFAPARVEVMPRRSIPRTENGKIRHAELRRVLEENPV